ncbi:hypothetical protein H7866_03290 [Staphylococcus hominis]|nr:MULTISPECIES: hypothetical protein [Staphylococcaceae]MBC3066746.1 hypothetical protein [Staphylococcus hominis]MBC3073223.1 hypothetical protein [Staphylococcus hominis]MCJ0911737.1 hypothetical protein [Mammaliicoccus sciuri]MDH9921192.1 hypothetical protein [Staphylococcus hominis]MDH9923432.1 hypothetical protein [Staphylococcus hominis]
MSNVKRELADQEVRKHNQEKVLVAKEVWKECPCGNVFEPEDSNQYLCNYCQEKYDKA